MAKRIRRRNPGVEMLQSAADETIITSGAVMDEAYKEYNEIDVDLATLARVEAVLESQGKELDRDARKRRRDLKSRQGKIDSLIAAYTKSIIKQAKSRIKVIKSSPMAGLHKRDIKTVEKDIFKLENMIKRKGADVRLMSNTLIGGLVTLEKSMAIQPSMTPTGKSKAEKERDNIRKLFLATYVRWDQVKKHAIKHDKFFIRGSKVFHNKYGSGTIIDNDGRKITVKFEGIPYKEMTKAKLTPGPVMWVDAQLDALKNKFKKGRSIVKSDIQRIVAKIVSIHNQTKPRAKLKTYRESKRALEVMIGKIETRLSGDKMDKTSVDAFLLELEEFQNRIPARMKSEWAKVDQRQWATDVTKVRKALVKLKRKANPCIGFHFHGKDADELLKAVEASGARQRKGVKENPTSKQKRKYEESGARKARKNREKGYAQKRKGNPVPKNNPGKLKAGKSINGWVVDSEDSDAGIRLGPWRAVLWRRDIDDWNKRVLTIKHSPRYKKDWTPDRQREFHFKWPDVDQGKWIPIPGLPKDASIRDAAKRVTAIINLKPGMGLPRKSSITAQNPAKKKVAKKKATKNPAKKKVAKSNPNGNTVTAIVFKVGKKPKKVKSVWSATEIAATVGGTKREFVPVGDDGYMVFAKKPLRHENERNDEATTTAGKKGHRPEIFGTAVLVPLSHRDEAFNASIGRLSRYGESPTERNPPKKKPAKKNVGIPGIMQGPFHMTKSQARREWNESKEGWYFTTSIHGDLYGPYDSQAVAEKWARSVGSGGPSGPERIGNPPKKKPAKKKATKKKATRKAKPEWQKLIDKCRKLWDHYCERPSKKRLKPVLEHLEKMKASTSKKVADERKSCLRIANKEARRLKLK